MRHLHWKLLVAVFVLAINSAAIGEEDAPDVDDILGNVDDQLIGVWEKTGSLGSRYNMLYLRPDGIAIFNEYEEDNPNVVYVCRYGVSGGYFATGESTDFTFEEGEWIGPEFDEDVREVASYEITDNTLTIYRSWGESIYTKSNAEIAKILVPDEVILYDGSTVIAINATVIAINSAAIAPYVDDVLGNVDDKVIGVWEATDEHYTELMYLRPDGIAIFNFLDEEDDPIIEVYVCRYGVSGGYFAMGESTDFTFEEGEWVGPEFDEEWRDVVPYDITDTTFTIHEPASPSWVYTKSTAEILVPDKVIVYDGSTSVETQSWGRIKAGLTH